jgi:arginine/lysine/histidine transporter system substrate-binding protein
MKRGLVIGLLLVVSSCVIWYSISRKKQQPPRDTFGFSTIIVGTHANYQPFTFIEDEHIVGFDIDLIKEVCFRLGVDIELKDMPFNKLLPALQLGEIHIVAAGLTPTPERAQLVFFTQPYLGHDPLLIISLAQHQPTLTSLADLRGHKVIVHTGYLSDTYLSEQEGLKLHRVASTEEGFSALLAGIGDAFVTAQSNAQPFFKTHTLKKFSITPLDESINTYALAISKKYPQLHTAIQNSLSEIVGDGTLDRLKKKWALEEK